jgi:arsenate reductase
MAAPWVDLLADCSKARAMSAGTEHGPQVHPERVTAMRDVGVDLAGAATTRLTPEFTRQAQLLVTMGWADQCPYVPGVERDDWPQEDPMGNPIEKVRAIRDAIRDRVRALIEREAWLQPTG